MVCTDIYLKLEDYDWLGGSFVFSYGIYKERLQNTDSITQLSTLKIFSQV